MATISGIYLITCTNDGLRYVGQSIDIIDRWRAHKRDLTKKNHKNSFFQRIHDKYGLDSFLFEILEEVPEFKPLEAFRDKLMEREQYYIDTLKPEINSRLDFTYNAFGYNLSEERVLKMSKTYSFIDPNGNMTAGINLRQLCILNELDHRAMSDVLNGIRFQHKGWTKDIENHKKYINYGRDGCSEIAVEVISPDGDMHTVYNKAQFARDHNLDSGNLRLLLEGHLLTHRGWSLVDRRDKLTNFSLLSYYLVDPDGNIHEGTNLSKFAKENNLVISNLRAVVTGREFSHYGWTNSLENHLILKAKQKQQSKPIFAKSPDGIEYEIKEGFKKFALEHNLNPGNLNSVLQGRRKHNKGWIVYYKDTNNNQPQTQNENQRSNCNS